jgi:hypothetical protein
VTRHYHVIFLMYFQKQTHLRKTEDQSNAGEKSPVRGEVLSTVSRMVFFLYIS